MKKNLFKLLSMMVVLALCAGLLTGCKGEPNGTDNRETKETGETMTTVNPDVSEPNQSIASGALIPETTTTETTPAPSGNVYTLRGMDFQLSVHLEDYIYQMDGSEYEYFNLEELMGHYGYTDETNESYLDKRYVYGNDTLMVSFLYDSKPDGVNPASGNPICGYINLTYRSSYDGYLGVSCLTGAGNIDRVFEVNGIASNGKTYSSYCLTWEQVVLLCVVLDDYAANGTTEAANNSICKVFESGGGADGNAIRLNK